MFRVRFVVLSTLAALVFASCGSGGSQVSPRRINACLRANGARSIRHTARACWVARFADGSMAAYTVDGTSPSVGGLAVTPGQESAGGVAWIAMGAAAGDALSACRS